ncbi:HTH-type transcriptional repressor CytR [Roseisalinus antarcticus]|uniref:HTH-type transcriptional repressor CytR n=2 Tax=Roseisalinus antarcticus TaxID=254357 RepID=A0A1Y5TXF4_9RHOB|nr:HTH-type transcriptional repressor CytR [Roseisalinus antarcticus]
MTLACVVPDLTNPFYPSLFIGVQETAGTAGYDVVAVNTNGDKAREQALVQAATQGLYDGVVGVFFALGARDFTDMVGAGVPLVRIEASRKLGGPLAIDDLYVDNFTAARGSVEALIAAGHRKIAMIAGSGGPEKVRVQGYCSALKAAGLFPSLWEDENFSNEGGRRAAKRLLDAETGITAIVAANDLMAIGAMQVLTAAGLCVPDDVSVVGFDDILAAGLVTPGLCTVSLDQEGLGRRAAQMLLDRVTGKFVGPARVEERPFYVRNRGSCGAARSDAQPI